MPTLRGRRPGLIAGASGSDVCSRGLFEGLEAESFIAAARCVAFGRIRVATRSLLQARESRMAAWATMHPTVPNMQDKDP